MSGLAWFILDNYHFRPLRQRINRLLGKPSPGYGRGFAAQTNIPYEAPPPPPTRARRLSITEEVPQRKYKKKPSEQLQSRLFRLPKELRLQIYEHAVGGRYLHLTLVFKGRMQKETLHPRCHTCEYGESHPTIPSQWTDCRSDQERLIVSLLPLLRSCRRVYTEAIYVLYSSNTFDFTKTQCLQTFIPRILPQRLEILRSVRLSYAMPHMKCHMLEENYDAPWQVLLTIPGLRQLYVRLSPPRFPQPTEFWTENDGEWLAPLRWFKKLDIFEVYLPMLRTQRLPRGLDVGSCQLYAVDAHGTPYRDHVGI